MSTSVTAPQETATSTPSRDRHPSRPPIARIPFGRVVAVELRKSFDTRAGSWLLVSIALTAVLATVAAVLWAPDEVMTFETFASAVGVPMSVFLPVVAALSVTSEWGQRTGLSTFTLVPGRGRTIAAKAVAALLVGVVSMVVAVGVGAVGNLIGSTVRDVDLVWDTSATLLATTVLAQVLSMALGFALGLLLRSAPAAIVGYFVVAFVLSGLTGLLALSQEWFADARPWVDFTFTQAKLYDTVLSGQEWLEVAAVTGIWVVAPLAVGLWRLRSAEIA